VPENTNLKCYFVLSFYIAFADTVVLLILVVPLIFVHFSCVLSLPLIT